MLRTIQQHSLTDTRSRYGITAYGNLAMRFQPVIETYVKVVANDAEKYRMLVENNDSDGIDLKIQNQWLHIYIDWNRF